MSQKSRFCPSPTGPMHLGNLRTALFNWLYARSSGGKFLIRIEDTDKKRSSSEYSKLLLQDLKKLGLNWDEGPQASAGEHSYYQSGRNHIYAKYFQQLEEKQLAYPCFCSPETLERTRKKQLAAGNPPRYPGTCARLSKDEASERRQNNSQEVLRFRIDKTENVEFNDLIRGQQFFHCSEFGDFIIRKQDGTPTFMFSNALDDALMQVSLVMRGEDHLTNTPRQILILRVLQLPIPEYAHLSIIVGNDGAPLSKRNGSVSIDELIRHGYHSLAICNYMARLGHVYEDNSVLDMDQMATHFNMQRTVKSSSRYDRDQLDYWQKKTIEILDTDSLFEWLAPILEQYQDYSRQDLITFLRNNITFPKDAQPWLAMLNEKINYSEQAIKIISQTNTGLFLTAENAIMNYKDWQSFIKDMQHTGLKGKSLFLPLRAALTGQITGPGLAELIQLIGTERAHNRLRQARNMQAS